MNDNTVMIEAVVKHEDANEIYEAFQNEPKMLGCTISPREGEAESDSIVCGFKNAKLRQVVVGKMERSFPGKISWR